MYGAGVFLVSGLAFVSVRADRTKDEWKTGIENLCLDYTEAYNAKDFSAVKDYCTDDFQAFRPGALRAVGVEGLDMSRHFMKVENVKVRWTAGDFAVFDWEVHQETSESVPQVEHVVSVVVDKNGILKFGLALWNFV